MITQTQAADGTGKGAGEAGGAKRTLTVALAGNPNSGKTTIFNNLTGARQHVGNYPGVTVERKEGFCRIGDLELRIVDLPGTYSLSTYSEDERIARDFILEERPDIVVDVLDSTNLERHLYLATQLIELGAPLILVFNMADAASRRGIAFDLGLLSRLFGAPIVETVGHKNVGTPELLEAVVRAASGDRPRPAVIRYGPEVDKALEAVSGLLDEAGGAAGLPSRWAALKLLEGDPDAARVSPEAAVKLARFGSASIEKRTGAPAQLAIAEGCYGFIAGACKEAVKVTAEAERALSERIDELLLSRILGLPIFLGLMYAVFHLTFTLGEAPMGWIEGMFGWLGGAIGGLWPEGSESALKSLLVDGIIGGVGGVLVFLPNILLLFFAISLLEASGYMARAAFLVDRFMHKIGLHGKSFIPMLIGFGCTVPAIMATRTLENKRDRLITMMVAPLMSCGARLPIYALIIPAFFPEAWRGIMLWTIYMIGILLAMAAAKVMSLVAFQGEPAPFVMELPPYRVPTVKSVAIHMWERSWLYLKKAGTIILGLSILLWFLTSYPEKKVFDRDYPAEAAAAEKVLEAAGRADEARADYEAALRAIEEAKSSEMLAYSVTGRIGHALEPLLRPMGFDWKIGTALVGSFAAKEVFVAQMGIVYSVGEADEESEALRETLARKYSPLVAFCIMLFCLVSAPCMATIAVTRRESNSWAWALLQLGGLTALAYVLTVLVYQGGRLLGIGV